MINLGYGKKTQSRPSRDSILTTALELFARRGYQSTSIKEIEIKSGCNSALIYYYFGSKKALYNACLGHLIRGFAELGTSILEGATPVRGVRLLIEHQLNYLTANPNLLRLLLREMLDHHGDLAGPTLQPVMAGLFNRLTEIIRAGQLGGQFSPNLDPHLAAVSTVAQAIYFLIANPILTPILATAGLPQGPELTARFTTHAGDFALAALGYDSGQGVRE